MDAELERYTVTNVDELQFILKELGVENPQVSLKDVAYFSYPYENDSRFFHNSVHPLEVGATGWTEPYGEFIPNGAFINLPHLSALGHDLCYFQVDGADKPDQAFPEIIKRKIGHLVEVKHQDGAFVATLTEAGKNDETIRLVTDIFGFSPDDEVLHHKAGNEYVSALALAKWMEEKGVNKQYIAVSAQNIAATYPFQPAGPTEAFPHQDGHMGFLAERLAEANTTYQLGLSEREVDAYTQMSVEVANRDVSAFWHEDWRVPAHNAIALSPEANAALRGNGPVTVHDLMAASTFSFYDAMLHNPNFPSPENIPHHYKGYPSPEEHQACVDKVRDNLEKAVAYHKAKRVGTAFASAVAELIGEESPVVPGFINEELSSLRDRDVHVSLPQGELKATEQDPILIVLRGRDKGKVGQFEPDFSPMAAFIYCKIGEEGINRLCNGVPNVYKGIKDIASFKDNKEAAQQFIKALTHELGKDNVNTLLQDMAYVARHPHKEAGQGNYSRAEAIEALGQNRFVSSGISRA